MEYPGLRTIYDILLYYFSWLHYWRSNYWYICIYIYIICIWYNMFPPTPTFAQDQQNIQTIWYTCHQRMNNKWWFPARHGGSPYSHHPFRTKRLFPFTKTIVWLPPIVITHGVFPWFSQPGWSPGGDLPKFLAENYLAGGWATLWKIWKSIGMISNPKYGKIKNGNQTTNQLSIKLMRSSTNGPKTSKNHQPIRQKETRLTSTPPWPNTGWTWSRFSCSGKASCTRNISVK